jgi:hypothetical protein
MRFRSLALLALATTIISERASAAVLDIPYFGGKQEQTVEVRYTDTITPIHHFFWSYAPTPDTIRAGSIFSLRLYYTRWNPDMNSLCSQMGELGIQLLSTGDVAQRKDSADAWETSTAYPDQSLLTPLPQVPHVDTGFPTISKAPGHVLAGEWSCEGTSYSLNPKWKRTLYFQGGSRFAKIGIESVQSKSWGVIPYYGYIISVRLRYILNDSNDLAANTTSARPSLRNRIEPRFGARVEHERYNPLGVRLRREPGRFEPSVTVPRRP